MQSTPFLGEPPPGEFEQRGGVWRGKGRNHPGLTTKAETAPAWCRRPLSGCPRSPPAPRGPRLARPSPAALCLPAGKGPLESLGHGRPACPGGGEGDFRGERKIEGARDRGRTGAAQTGAPFPLHSRRGADLFRTLTATCVLVPRTAGKRGCLMGAVGPQRLREAPRSGTGRASPRSPAGPAQCAGRLSVLPHAPLVNRHVRASHRQHFI